MEEKINKTDSRVTKKITRLSVFYALRRGISESIILIKKTTTIVNKYKKNHIYLRLTANIYSARRKKIVNLSRLPVAIFADTVTMQKNNVPMK